MPEFLEVFYPFDKAPTDPAVSQPFLAKLAEQEAELEFSSFNASDALALGLAILAESPKAKTPDAPGVRAVVVHVSINGNLQFYSAQDGTNADNYGWIQRKVNTVTRFGRASIFMGSSCMAGGKDFNVKFLLPETEYVGVGGGFPLRVKGVAYPVGVVAVSGLPHQMDHELVTKGIKKYLESKK
ncbi:hypothetical protein POJ06DRAFT_242331 [Lipomyces tetrasporus]|uniref:DUF967 domain protein n=1 Tax=Lipomyces tetrasporus TaxID=54092 RepID=A0AAD7VVK4_9ASCO|nr:uncharacterized protein POJ06DRAFT_242331 [Lipomyces tetrasporus]KAJ8103583.1 hypothetical protein POJ06DRAFT_242331 [Lipomyces tetrasporus]